MINSERPGMVAGPVKCECSVVCVGTIEAYEKCIVRVELLIDSCPEDIAVRGGNSGELIVRKNTRRHVEIGAGKFWDYQHTGRIKAGGWNHVPRKGVAKKRSWISRIRPAGERIVDLVGVFLPVQTIRTDLGAQYGGEIPPRPWPGSACLTKSCRSGWIGIPPSRGKTRYGSWYRAHGESRKVRRSRHRIDFADKERGKVSGKV